MIIQNKSDIFCISDQLPPYYTQELFDIIKTAKADNPLNIITMSEKEWTRLLTDKYITMEVNQVTSIQQFRPCKAEIDRTSTDWELS